MTRDEAYRRIQVIPRSSPSMQDVVFIVELLGLIKFDEPKTANHLAVERLMRTMTEVSTTSTPEFAGCLTGYGAACILESLEAAGLKIVRAP